MDEPNQGQDAYEKSVDHLRATAKWTLVAFAAVGTVLVAGSQLSSIGKFELTDGRFLIAAIAALFVLGAIGYAIWLVIGVETEGEVSLGDLNSEDIQFVNQNPELLGGYPSIDKLRDDYRGYINQKYSASQEGNQDDLNYAAQWVADLGALVGQLLSAVRYDRVARQFRKATPILIIMSVAAGIAVGAFAWAANPAPPSAEAPAFKMPTEAYADLTDSGETMLSSRVGEDCAKLPVHVIVLSATNNGYDVTSIPTKHCAPVRFTLHEEMGSVWPPDAVDVRRSEP